MTDAETQAWCETHITDCLRWRALYNQQFVEHFWAFAVPRSDCPEGLRVEHVHAAALSLAKSERITHQSDGFFLVTSAQLRALGGEAVPAWRSGVVELTPEQSTELRALENYAPPGFKLVGPEEFFSSLVTASAVSAAHWLPIVVKQSVLSINEAPKLYDRIDSVWFGLSVLKDIGTFGVSEPSPELKERAVAAIQKVLWLDRQRVR